MFKSFIKTRWLCASINWRKSNYSYPVVSGKKGADSSFTYSPGRQRTPSGGPIPEGEYWINPGELWKLEWHDFWTDEDGWGKYRVTVHPFTKTVTHRRGGFFIHGGKNPGSSGCIDLTSYIARFVENLSKEGARRKCQIHLTVQYTSGKKMKNKSLSMFCVLVVILILAIVSFINYHALSEAFGDGPPYYSQTVNMDKW